MTHTRSRNGLAKVGLFLCVCLCDNDHFWPGHFWPRPLFFDQTVLCPSLCKLDLKKPWPMGLVFGICCSCLIFGAMDLPSPPNTSLQDPSTPRPPCAGPTVVLCGVSLLLRCVALCCVVFCCGGVCVLWCGVSVLCVIKIFVGASKIWALSRTLPPPDASSAGPLLSRNTNWPNSKRAHSRAPALQTPPNSTKRPPREEERKLWREREKKREILGSPLFGAPLLHKPETAKNWSGPKVVRLGAGQKWSPFWAIWEVQNWAKSLGQKW